MLENYFGSIHPITISEVTYRLVTCILAIRFKNTFTKHINLHQFGVAIRGGCEIIVHGVQAMLDCT
jgi:hypothetical protein